MDGTAGTKEIITKSPRRETAGDFCAFPWDDPEWDNEVRDGDAARAEQRAGKKYQETKESRQIAEDASVRSALEEKFAEKRWEAEENDRIADGLSTQAAIDEKLAMREYQKFLESVNDGEYTDLGTIHIQEQELRSSDSPIIGPIKDYYNSIEQTGPFEFQVVVDSREEMKVHTVRHLGKIALDVSGMITLLTGAISSAASTPATGIAGAYFAISFMEGFATAGISLVSEIGATINDIATYNRTGCVISTVSPLTDPGEYIMWIAMGAGNE